jgi:hypothetical protein
MTVHWSFVVERILHYFVTVDNWKKEDGLGDLMQVLVCLARIICYTLTVLHL